MCFWFGLPGVKHFSHLCIQLTTPLWITLENVDLGDGDEGSGANMVSHMLGSIGYTTRSLIHTVNVV